MEVRPLHPLFAAEMLGLDLSQAPTPDVVDAVEAAMAEHAVVVIRGQAHIGDAEHIAFSRSFGPLELPPNLNFRPTGQKRRFAPELYDASNLDVDGNIAGAESLNRKYAKGNELFHTDSSFNSLPTKWSLLLGHIVTPERGETEFVDTRAAYDRLSPEEKALCETLTVEHNVWRSRERSGFENIEALKKSLPAVQHPLVRTSASGRKALYLGSHADHIVGWDIEEGRAFLEDLVQRATTPDMIYAHKWQQGDLLIWDNRCTMHRATTFEYLRDKRDLRRTTINEYGEERAANEGVAAAA